MPTVEMMKTIRNVMMLRERDLRVRLSIPPVKKREKKSKKAGHKTDHPSPTSHRLTFLLFRNEFIQNREFSN